MTEQLVEIVQYVLKNHYQMMLKGVNSLISAKVHD
jgi:hypothetical protein